MKTFQKLIDEYGRDSDIEKMEMLTNKIDCFVEAVREHDPELVDLFLVKVDLLLNPHFTKETAKYAVSKMKNKDGTTGEHWSYETTSKVLKNKSYDHHDADWYYTLNMIYSDFYKQGRSDDTYIELACDYIDDVDAPEDKVKKLYLASKS